MSHVGLCSWALRRFFHQLDAITDCLLKIDLSWTLRILNDLAWVCIVLLRPDLHLEHLSGCHCFSIHRCVAVLNEVENCTPLSFVLVVGSGVEAP